MYIYTPLPPPSSGTQGAIFEIVLQCSGNVGRKFWALQGCGSDRKRWFALRLKIRRDCYATVRVCRKPDKPSQRHAALELVTWSLAAIVAVGGVVGPSSRWVEAGVFENLLLEFGLRDFASWRQVQSGRCASLPGQPTRVLSHPQCFPGCLRSLSAVWRQGEPCGSITRALKTPFSFSISRPQKQHERAARFIPAGQQRCMGSPRACQRQVHRLHAHLTPCFGKTELTALKPTHRLPGARNQHTISGGSRELAGRCWGMWGDTVSQLGTRCCPATRTYRWVF